MEISILHRLYNVYGGQKSISAVGALLELDCPSFGDAVQELQIEVLFAQSGPPRKSLEEMHQNFHDSLKHYPKCTFYRAKSRMKLEIEGDFASGLEIQRERVPNQIRYEWVEKTFELVVSALPVLRKKIRKDDDFDFEKFEQHVLARLSNLPKTAEAIQEIVDIVSTRRTEEYEKKGPWEKLGIDWAEFHPDARSLIPAPELWSCADDFAPNGNDTGADVIEMYRSWSKKKTSNSPFEFLDNLSASWGMHPNVQSGDSDPFDVYAQAVVALAFASIKIHGKCKGELKNIALEATNYQIVSSKKLSDWPFRDEAISKYELVYKTIEKWA